jgi:hypothetical protein
LCWSHAQTKAFRKCDTFESVDFKAIIDDNRHFGLARFRSRLKTDSELSGPGLSALRGGKSSRFELLSNEFFFDASLPGDLEKRVQIETGFALV